MAFPLWHSVMWCKHYNWLAVVRINGPVVVITYPGKSYQLKTLIHLSRLLSPSSESWALLTHFQSDSFSTLLFGYDTIMTNIVLFINSDYDSNSCKFAFQIPDSLYLIFERYVNRSFTTNIIFLSNIQTLSDALAEDNLWKYCGKRRSCSWLAICLFCRKLFFNFIQ